MAIEQEFEVFSGNDVTLSVTVTDEDNDGPLNLTGAVALIWKLALSPSATPKIIKDLTDGITIVDPNEGLVEILIDAADLEPLKGAFYHELRLTNSLNKKSTLMYGAVTIKDNLVKDV